MANGPADGWRSRRGCLVGGAVAVDEATIDGNVVQPPPEMLSSTVQPAHDRAYRDVEGLCDLARGEAVHVGEHHDQPGLPAKRVYGPLHLRVGEPVHQLVLSRPSPCCRLAAVEPPVEIEVLDVVEVGLGGPPLLATGTS